MQVYDWTPWPTVKIQYQAVQSLRLVIAADDSSLPTASGGITTFPQLEKKSRYQVTSSTTSMLTYL